MHHFGTQGQSRFRHLCELRCRFQCWWKILPRTRRVEPSRESLGTGRCSHDLQLGSVSVLLTSSEAVAEVHPAKIRDQYWDSVLGLFPLRP